MVELLSCPIMGKAHLIFLSLFFFFVCMCTSHLTHLILNEQIEYYNILYYFHQIYRKRKGTLVWRVTFEQRGEEFEAMTDRWGSGVHSLIFTLPFGLFNPFLLHTPNTQYPIPKSQFLSLLCFCFCFCF